MHQLCQGMRSCRRLSSNDGKQPKHETYPRPERCTRTELSTSDNCCLTHLAPYFLISSNSGGSSWSERIHKRVKQIFLQSSPEALSFGGIAKQFTVAYDDQAQARNNQQ